LIGELARDDNVIPLAYHVDYWNYLGWRDPFSSKSWTERQMMYVRSFQLSSAYTPQAVVNGGKQYVGSDERSLRATIRAESMRPAEALVAVRAGVSRVHVTASSQRPHLDVLLAIVENGNVTPVARGENSGRSLRNDFVVRRVQRIGSLDKASVDADLPLELDAVWKQHPLHVVAFAQDRQTLRIYGAASAAIP
jgi:hypothetical protein